MPLLPAAWGGILTRIRMGPSHITSGVSDSVRKTVADSEELKRKTLLQSFASHSWAFAENSSRMGKLPVSLCFCNILFPCFLVSALNTTGLGQRCRPLQMGNLAKVAAACISLFAAAHTQLCMVNCESRLRLAWCCRQTQRSQQIPMISLLHLK